MRDSSTHTQLISDNTQCYILWSGWVGVILHLAPSPCLCRCMFLFFGLLVIWYSDIPTLVFLTLFHVFRSRLQFDAAFSSEVVLEGVPSAVIPKSLLWLRRTSTGAFNMIDFFQQQILEFTRYGKWAHGYSLGLSGLPSFPFFGRSNVEIQWPLLLSNFIIPSKLFYDSLMIIWIIWFFDRFTNSSVTSVPSPWRPRTQTRMPRAPISSNILQSTLSFYRTPPVWEPLSGISTYYCLPYYGTFFVVPYARPRATWWQWHHPPRGSLANPCMVEYYYWLIFIILAWQISEETLVA